MHLNSYAWKCLERFKCAHTFKRKYGCHYRELSDKFYAFRVTGKLNPVKSVRQVLSSLFKLTFYQKHKQKVISLSRRYVICFLRFVCKLLESFFFRLLLSTLLNYFDLIYMYIICLFRFVSKCLSFAFFFCYMYFDVSIFFLHI